MTDERIEGSIKQGAGKIQDAAGGLTGDTDTQVHGKIDQGAGSVQNVMEKVKGQAQDAFDQTKQQAQGAYSKVEGYVSDQPFRTVGISLIAGIVIGMLIRGGSKTVYVRKWE